VRGIQTAVPALSEMRHARSSKSGAEQPTADIIVLLGTRPGVPQHLGLFIYMLPNILGGKPETLRYNGPA
jgi:hypothetical protein